mmetsp:Transcript_4085/g.9607  ORF Transcript_4085/g.9607 Transcript_4085/m.9607 type:complete len:219 (+) Transcript_4085:1642-2298(+)
MSVANTPGSPENSAGSMTPLLMVFETMDPSIIAPRNSKAHPIPRACFMERAPAPTDVPTAFAMSFPPLATAREKATKNSIITTDDPVSSSVLTCAATHHRTTRQAPLKSHIPPVSSHFRCQSDRAGELLPEGAGSGGDDRRSGPFIQLPRHSRAHNPLLAREHSRECRRRHQGTTSSLGNGSPCPGKAHRSPLNSTHLASPQRLPVKRIQPGGGGGRP